MKKYKITHKITADFIAEAIVNEDLHNVECKFNKISGKTYHLYQKNDGKKYFSMISPTEWNSKDLFLNSYFYDYDKTFVMVEVS